MVNWKVSPTQAADILEETRLTLLALLLAGMTDRKVVHAWFQERGVKGADGDSVGCGCERSELIWVCIACAAAVSGLCSRNTLANGCGVALPGSGKEGERGTTPLSEPEPIQVCLDGELLPIP